MKKKTNQNQIVTTSKKSVIIPIISGIVVLAYIGLNSSEYFALKAQIQTPSVQPTQTQNDDDKTATTNKVLNSIEPNLDALKAGQRTGVIGRENPMSKLFFTKDDLKTILDELEVAALSDDEMNYISSNLALKSNNNYSEDKNTVVQTILELENSKTTGNKTNVQSSTGSSNSTSKYNSISDFTH